MTTPLLYEVLMLEHQDRLEQAAKQRLAYAARHKARGERHRAPWGWLDRRIHHRGADRPPVVGTPRRFTEPPRRSLHMQPFVYHMPSEARDSTIDIAEPEFVEHRDLVPH